MVVLFLHPARPSKPKLLIVATLVSAGLLSTALYLQPRSWLLKSHMGPVELGALDTELPALPSYDLKPDIAYNVRSISPFSPHHSTEIVGNQLGPYSPRYVVPSNISSELPEGCTVSMVNIVSQLA